MLFDLLRGGVGLHGWMLDEVHRIRRVAEDFLVLRSEDLALYLLRCRVAGDASLFGDVAAVYASPCRRTCRAQAVPCVRISASQVLALGRVFAAVFSSRIGYARKTELVLVVLEHNVAIVLVPVIVGLAQKAAIGFASRSRRYVAARSVRCGARFAAMAS